MAGVIVKALKIGPYEVAGGARLLDHAEKNPPRVRSIRSIPAAPARQRTNRSAMAAMKTSASRRKKRPAREQYSKIPLFHHSNWAQRRATEVMDCREFG